MRIEEPILEKDTTKDKTDEDQIGGRPIARGESYVLFPRFLSIIIHAALRVLQITSRTNV